MFLRIRFPVLVAFIAVCSLPVAVSAQEADAPLFAQVRTTYVKPGMNAVFESFIKRLNTAREKAKWPQGSLVSQARTGENAYYTVGLYNRYGDLKNNVRSLFSEREWVDMMGQIEKSVAGGMVQTFFARADLGRPGGIAPPDADAFLTILVTVKQGGGPDYEEALHKLVEATNKVAPELGWITYSPDLSSANVYRFVIPWSWETIDQPGLSIPERYLRAFGEEEGVKWIQQLNEPIESVDTFMTVNRPDLSYFPEQ